MPHITVNKLKIFYFDNNIRDIPLFFIHGWLGRSNEWKYQLFYFNSRYHIILMDLPGFGKSDKPNIKYSIEFYTKQILDFFKLMNYNEVIIIGHSLGGMIAQNIAIQKPKIVKKLILISTTAALCPTYIKKFKLIWFNLFFKLGYKMVLKSIINRIISTDNGNREFKKLYNYALDIPKQVVLSSFKNMTLKFNVNKLLVKIYQPTLLIYGNEDNIISKSNIYIMQCLIPNSEMFIIKNSSHRLMVEHHMNVNRIIEEFIIK